MRTKKTMNENSMGKRIMMLRKRAGLTQEQLAEKLSVSPQAVSKWENDVSCPDITMLPLLAEVFDVSTDALLGRIPLDENDTEAEAEARAETWEEPKREPETVEFDSKQPERSKWYLDRGAIGFGLVLILVGVAYILNRTMDIEFEFWGVVWSAALFGFSLAAFLKSYAPIMLAPAGIGFYYLLSYLDVELPFAMSWSVIWPALLILFGLTVIKDAIWKKHRWTHWANHEGDYSEADGFIRMDMSFGEERRRPICEIFRGADVDVSFGSAALDLTGVHDFAPEACIKADVSFGSLEIRLPADVYVESRPDTSVGVVNIQGSYEKARRRVRLESDVSFGSIEVRY